MPLIRECVKCGAKNRVSTARLNDTARCGACKAAIPPVADPLSVNTETFDEILQSAQVPILVDFWAEWCEPCRMAAPHVAKTARDLAGKALVLKVDTEKNPELAGRYQVRGIPNFAVFAGGKLIQQQAGLVDGDQMVRWLKAAGA